MKTLLLSLALVLFIRTTSYSQQKNAGYKAGQTSTNLPCGEEIFTVCEQPPTFPDGQEGLNNFIRTNLHYQNITLKKRGKDKVFVSFIVTCEGTIRDVTIVKGISPEANEEVIRLVRSMPNWIPGKQAGHLVNFKNSLVIPFRLSNLK